MKTFQAIARANPSPADGHPSRNNGEPGYKASVDYVASVMKRAGYRVTVQPFKFTYYAFKTRPTMSEVSPNPQTYALGDQWNAAQSTGTTTAGLQPAGGIVLNPSSPPPSGCATPDFSGFVAGRIALIQRGGCPFGVKVLNAQAAGASGVIIFNDGSTPDRSGVTSGALVDAELHTIIPTIPVAFTSYGIGADLYQTATTGTALPVMSLNIEALVNPDADNYNVIAESKGGDPNHVLVVDAHLDSIYGAGMLDNASGSSAVLDIAQKMRKVHPLNKVRFIWFGGEELALLGSVNYLSHLTAAELSQIGYDLDADVMASPNYVIGILDPSVPGPVPTPPFSDRVYQASTVSRDQSIQYFDSIGLNHELRSPSGPPTDAFSFNNAGIPASGLLTGQDCCKNQAEVDLFGGSLGNFEGNIPSTDGGCVDNPFLWCDNLNNNDPRVLTTTAKAFANTVIRMAFDTTVMSTSSEAAVKAKVPRASDVGRRSVPQ